MDETDEFDDVRTDFGSIARAVWAWRYRIILVTLVLCAITYGALMFVPKTYDSTASLLVQPRSNAYTRAAGDTNSATGVPTDAQIASQVELIKSRDTLLQVVNALHLRDVPELNGSRPSSPVARVLDMIRPSKPASNSIDDIVLANMLDSLTVERARSSNVITITYSSTDPQLAAKIANALAKAHVERAAGLQIQDTADATKWLQTEIDKMRQRVSAAEKRVADFKVKNDLFTGTNNTSLTDQQLSDLSSQITAAQQAKNAAQSRADLIRSLIKQNKPIDGIPDVRNSAVIQQLSEQKAQLQSERAQKLATLLPSHPEIKALTAQISELNAQIDAEGRRVADALEADAKVQAQLESSLRDDLARLKLKASDATRQNVTLSELEREASAERDVLQTYLQRYRDASGRTDPNSALPDVRVVAQAAPALAPSAPKTKLVLVAVAIIALALQIGSIMFRELASGRALVRAAPGRGPGDSGGGGDDTTGPREDDDERVVDFTGTASSERDAGEGRVVTASGDIDEDRFAVAPVGENESLEPRAFPHFGRRVDQPVAMDAGEATAEQQEDGHRQADVDWEEWDAATGTAQDADGPDRERAAADDDEDEMVAAGGAQDAASPREEIDLTAGPEDDVLVSGDEIAVNEDGVIVGGDAEIAALSGDIGMGHERVLAVAEVGERGASWDMAETLVAGALARGLSVVRIDAASRKPSNEPGLTDLAEGHVDFGDVVQRGNREGLSEVAWGHGRTINRRSERPVTLIAALSDIYEVVIIVTGRMGTVSTLPLFAGSEPLVVLAAGRATSDQVAGALEDITALGFARSQVFAISPSHTEVA